MPERLPVSAAEKVCKEYKCKQVIIVAWDGERTHVVTYGITKLDCKQAAHASDLLKPHLGIFDV